MKTATSAPPEASAAHAEHQPEIMSATRPNPRRALLLENIHPRAADRLRGAGLEVETCRGSLTELELKDRLAGVSVLGVRSKTQVTEEVVEAASDLEVVGAFCIGTNQIDLDACLARGIPVFNAPFSNTRSVVELALGQIIVLLRNVLEKSSLLHRGEWRKSSGSAREVRGKRLGIVGYGKIGAQLSILAEALGMDVRFYDVEEKLALGNAEPCRTLDELLATSDVVSVHVDGRADNRNLFGAREFAAMKDDAVFINLSRGFVVDLEALREALESGKLRSAAVDVFPREPKQDGSGFESPLQGLDNVLLTPHIGGSTEEAQENIGNFVPDKLLNYLEMGTTSLAVNFPNLQLPELRGAHRLLHIHRNVPGILAQINQVLAEQEMNVRGQYLKTTDEVGYVITDVGRDYDEGVVQALRQIPETIRVRVLY
jgi:D-3-phosphoglycerate dehydrogenase / 2-oxoglutarate reductase